ncbi:MAG: flotillin family protein [Leptospiraceae bacterium]|nr:flotillin family protein [Leptospiraceae bacterium]MCP5498750.1 flotillin family protein [Leptospiraceae bacterium]
MNTFPALIILMAFPLLVVITFLIFLFTRIKVCPPNKMMVVYGGVGPNQDFVCVRGGRKFIWPILQKYAFLDLAPMYLNTSVTGNMNQTSEQVYLSITLSLHISPEPGFAENAARKLLGLSEKQMIALAEEFVKAELSSILFQFSGFEDMNSDREKLADVIIKTLETRLEEIGLRILNVNVKDLRKS